MNSPARKKPKKATQQAAHNMVASNLLSCGACDHDSSNVSNMSRVTGRRGGLGVDGGCRRIPLSTYSISGVRLSWGSGSPAAI